MRVFGRLRLDIKHERAEMAAEELRVTNECGTSRRSSCAFARTIKVLTDINIAPHVRSTVVPGEGRFEVHRVSVGLTSGCCRLRRAPAGVPRDSTARNGTESPALWYGESGEGLHDRR
jgi:hypothetical protein